MDSFFKDLRYAARMMVTRPAFTLVAVLSLALGIGANTTIFTLAKAAFLQTVPVNDPATLVMVYSNQHNTQGDDFHFQPQNHLNALDIREKNQVFSGASLVIPAPLTLEISNSTSGVFGELVDWDFFHIVGVPPALGRDFRPDEDDKVGSGPVAILSYGFWNKQFGADRSILGRTIRVNHQDITVIGVAPREYHDAGALFNPDLWMPASMADQMLSGQVKQYLHQRFFRDMFVVARLKPGVSVAAADQSMHTLGAVLAHDFPKENSGRGFEVVPINDTVIPPQGRDAIVRATVVMVTIVGLVLLIACANVANLLLSRATLRQREIAIRLSMGARRSRLIRQLLTESLMLGVLAGALAILFAFWGRGLIRRLIPGGLPTALDVSLDLRVLLFTLVLSVLATLLFGLMPALQSSKSSQVNALRDRSATGSGGSTHWYSLRGVLVMVQVALSLVALVGAGLFIHSLVNAQQIDPGFEVQHELTIFLNFTAQQYSQARAEQFFKEVVDRLRGLPMVADASIADRAPLNGGISWTTFPEGVDPSNSRNGVLTPVFAVQPGYFSAAGIALQPGGRDFNDHDDVQGQQVAIVNRAFVDRNWPKQNAIGKKLRFMAQPGETTVVGVASTVKVNTLGEDPQGVIYFPLKQHYAPAVTLYVRTRGNPSAALGSIRSAIQSMDPALQLRGIQTVRETIDQSLIAPRLGAELLGTFGALA
ncbi:MAG: ABC transporter permease, partial [Acidobacteria bacterium]|nr:ABC transporter permease [Acidobacteriota bacterium]